MATQLITKYSLPFGSQISLKIVTFFSDLKSSAFISFSKKEQTSCFSLTRLGLNYSPYCYFDVISFHCPHLAYIFVGSSVIFMPGRFKSLRGNSKVVVFSRPGRKSKFLRISMDSIFVPTLFSPSRGLYFAIVQASFVRSGQKWWKDLCVSFWALLVHNQSVNLVIRKCFFFLLIFQSW